jgi:2-methylisocitrate lyase-like PEP mutase family enzyme
MTTQARKLRALIDSGKPFIAADAYSAVTGRIVEQVGFPAAYLGGHACSAFHYALPDYGMFSQVEQIEQAARIVAAIDIPLIVDADQLGETIADAFHFTRRHERAGIAGFHVEDEVNPKHSSYSNGLMPIAEMQAKIEACTKAREDPAFVIIARCDELYPDKLRGGGGNSIDEAIRRGQAYADAGADVLVFPLASAEAHVELLAAIKTPICVLGDLLPGTAFSLHTGWGWTGAVNLHFERARQLMKDGTLPLYPPIEEKAALLEQDLYDAMIADWAKGSGRPVR